MGKVSENRGAKDLKEQVISLVTRTMSEALSSDQLDMLIYTMTHVLESYDISEAKDLPSTDVCDAEKLINSFLTCKKIEGCLSNTLMQYKYVVYRFITTVNMDIFKITTNTIRYYLGILSVDNQNSYVDSVRRTLNSFFQWMENEDLIPKNPCKKLKRIKMEKKMEMPYSDEEITLMQDACTSPKEVALVDLLVGTGIRREEITKIKLADIDFLNDSIVIHGKGAKERIVYFSSRCKVHLRTYLNTRGYDSEYLFASDRKPHGKLTVNSLHGYIKNIGIRAGVSNVHLHRFRKWFATSMINKGVKIQDLKEMMGHESIETTNSYYIFSNVARIRSECKIHAA